MTAKTFLRYGLLLSLISIPCTLMGWGTGPLTQATEGASAVPTPLAEGSIADANRDAAQPNLHDVGLAGATPMPLPGPDLAVDPVPLPDPVTGAQVDAGSPIDPVPVAGSGTISDGPGLIEATPTQLS